MAETASLEASFPPLSLESDWGWPTLPSSSSAAEVVVVEAVGAVTAEEEVCSPEGAGALVWVGSSWGVEPPGADGGSTGEVVSMDTSGGCG